LLVSSRSRCWYADDNTDDAAFTHFLPRLGPLTLDGTGTSRFIDGLRETDKHIIAIGDEGDVLEDDE